MVGPSKHRMQFINKTTSRPNSHELRPEDHSEKIHSNNNKMDAVYIYAAGPAPSKMVKRRESRIRSSLFGGSHVKRGSCELAPDETETSGMKSPSRSMTSSLASDDKENLSFLNRRKLRKSTSHASLASMSTAYETQRQEKLGRRGFADLLRVGGGKQTSPVRPSIGSRKLTHPISKPFNFSHITHTNSQTFGQIQQTEDSVLVQDWHKAVRESRMPGARRKTESTVVITPAALQRTTSVRSRKRANTNLTISPQESLSDLSLGSPNRSQESLRYACPVTPPPRTTSRHCLRSLAENPTEEDYDECVFRPGRDSVFLLNGRKTPEQVMRNRLSGDSDSSSSSNQDEFEEGVLELRSSKSTPDFLTLRHKSFLAPGRRPVSQISQVSDTLNGTFAPSSPHRMSMAARRMSRRVSMRPDALAGDVSAFLDSWEEDIDWCYEHEVDADCEFDWDRSEYETTPAPFSESTLLNNDMLKVPGTDEFILVEKRITGVFEDKLLLPPSPQLTSFPDSTIGLADGGFEPYEPENEDIIIRAASTALRHRSISSAASLPDLIPSRSYRDELNRVARQLDDHIAALNQETYSLRPISTNARDPHAFYLGSRTRAYSEATCVTLCSDTDTITPIDTNEIITPSSSAHNSFQFTNREDGRAEKGLSFPAAALPGVIEFAPDGLHHIAPEEQEFVHFI